MKKEDFLIFSMRLSPIDKEVLDSLCNSLDMNASDVMRCALMEFALVSKNTLLKSSVKELARLKKIDFKMQVMKEIEHITHKQAFYIDGFRTLIEKYHSKYVPIEVVRRYVTIKIISLYTLYSTEQRKEFVNYLKKHFLHFYPKEKKWVYKQLNYIRSMKKNEKDELLAKLTRGMPQMQEMGKIVSGQPLLAMPSKRREDFGAEAKDEK